MQHAILTRKELEFNVSTLTQPEGRVQLEAQHARFVLALVSTLTQPEGRVQPVGIMVQHGANNVSTLTQPEGRVQPQRRAWESTQFAGVSTLTQPEGRVQLPLGRKGR